MGDYDWLGPLIGGVGKAANTYATGAKANDQMQQAYAEMLANFQQRMGDYDALGSAGYKDVSPVLLGDTALAGIPEDAQGRLAQQEAMAALSDLISRGGLSLGDQKAVNDIGNSLNQQDAARRKGLSNEFAARGQLGSGAQLAMALQGQSDAAMGANQRSESVAAQAQQRALQAILEKGRMGRGMANDDYSRKADAARARDAIEARNAAARMGAQNANNALRGRAFDDSLAKAHGKTSLTNSMNKAVFDRGAQSARTTAAMGDNTNKLIDTGASAWDSYNKGGSSSGGGDYAPGYSEDDEINFGDDD